MRRRPARRPGYPPIRHGWPASGTRRRGPLVTDASSLRNFSAIREIGLLRTHVGDEIRWVEAVENEILTGRYEEDSERQHILDYRFWLGPPVRFEDGREAIETLRRSLGGTRRRGEQSLHLGEAQSIYLVETVLRGVATFLTDDRLAADMARRRGIAVVDTFDILRDCFLEDSLQCPQPYELLVGMARRGRGVRLPDSHGEIC